MVAYCTSCTSPLARLREGPIARRRLVRLSKWARGHAGGRGGTHSHTSIPTPLCAHARSRGPTHAPPPRCPLARPKQYTVAVPPGNHRRHPTSFPSSSHPPTAGWRMYVRGPVKHRQPTPDRPASPHEAIIASVRRRPKYIHTRRAWTRLNNEQFLADEAGTPKTYVLPVWQVGTLRPLESGDFRQSFASQRVHAPNVFYYRIHHEYE